MTAAAFRTESELCVAFQGHLEQLGWECYPEVEVRYGPGRADLVAYLRPVLWVIEAKLHLNEAVCGQAERWLGRAHFVSILVPAGGAHGVLMDWCAGKGIGVYAGWRDHPVGGMQRIQFRTDVPNRLHRIKTRLAQYLHPDMKKAVPGSNAGGYSTPFSRTMDAAVAFIKAHPGCGPAEVVKGIPHHYLSDKTAKRCLLDWLGKDSRVKVSKLGGVRFFDRSDPEPDRVLI